MDLPFGVLQHSFISYSSHHLIFFQFSIYDLAIWTWWCLIVYAILTVFDSLGADMQWCLIFSALFRLSPPLLNWMCRGLNMRECSCVCWPCPQPLLASGLKGASICARNCTHIGSWNNWELREINDHSHGEASMAVGVCRYLLQTFGQTCRTQGQGQQAQSHFPLSAFSLHRQPETNRCNHPQPMYLCFCQ